VSGKARWTTAKLREVIVSTLSSPERLGSFEPVTLFLLPGFHFNSHSSADWKSKNASTFAHRF